MLSNSCGKDMLNKFHQYSWSHKSHVSMPSLIWLSMHAHCICSSIIVIQSHSMCEWTTFDSSPMAHFVHLPMMVMVCRTADAFVLQRWQQYHAYWFDYEFFLYEYYDFERPGVYVAFVSSHDPWFGLVQMTIYDPWWCIGQSRIHGDDDMVSVMWRNIKCIAIVWLARTRLANNCKLFGHRHITYGGYDWIHALCFFHWQHMHNCWEWDLFCVAAPHHVAHTL